MAYSPIDKPNTHFNPVLYTGNGGTLNVTGVGFQPDLVWQKSRSLAYNHNLYDVVRGANAHIRSNLTDAEASPSDGLTSFNSDGYTMVQGGGVEASNNGATYLSWNWKAGGTASSNTDGTITSSVSANTTNGFSVVTYTGNATTSQSVGHGLNSVPKMIIVKNRIDASDWKIYHASLGTSYQMLLNNNDAAALAGTLWGSTTPTSNLFYINNDGSVNGSGDGMVAYCFADVKGFSKMGSYVGNGNADGTFIYTGFSPSFILFKNSSVTESWTILDLKRASVPNANPNANVLWPNDNYAEYDETQGIDFLSNGFKVRESATGFNGSGNTIIYMAFAENPLVASNYVPTTAR